MRHTNAPGVPLLVLAAAACVLAAPMAGRVGAPRLADVLAGLATLFGVGAFAAAAVHTWRAARRSPSRSLEGDET